MINASFRPLLFLLALLVLMGCRKKKSETLSEQAWLDSLCFADLHNSSLHGLYLDPKRRLNQGLRDNQFPVNTKSLQQANTKLLVMSLGLIRFSMRDPHQYKLKKCPAFFALLPKGYKAQLSNTTICGSESLTFQPPVWFKAGDIDCLCFRGRSFVGRTVRTVASFTQAWCAHGWDCTSFPQSFFVADESKARISPMASREWADLVDTRYRADSKG